MKLYIIIFTSNCTFSKKRNKLKLFFIPFVRFKKWMLQTQNMMNKKRLQIEVYGKEWNDMKKSQSNNNNNGKK